MSYRNNKKITLPLVIKERDQKVSDSQIDSDFQIDNLARSSKNISLT